MRSLSPLPWPDFPSSVFYGGHLYCVGLYPPVTDGAVAVGQISFSVSSAAEPDDTQVVTLSGQVYTDQGEVLDLVPLSRTVTVHTFVDTDNDGMDDNWEQFHFETLGRDGADDWDRDGLSDLEEHNGGTNPKVFDFGHLIACDFDNSGFVDLMDAIIALKVTAGLHVPEPLYKGASADGDSRIGIEDIVFVLQAVAGLR